MYSNSKDEEYNTTNDGTNGTYSNSGDSKRRFILEIPVFIVYFAINLSSTVFQNQLLYQSCTAVFNYSKRDCEPMLGKTNGAEAAQEIESRVQPYVSQIIMVRSLVESIVPAVLSLFIGPWSDKFGRRPILIITIIGYILNYIICTILAIIAINNAISPWLFIISSVPSSIVGASCAMMIVVYCYISDVAKPEKKAIRMVLNYAAVGVGLVVGNLVSGYLFAATNMATVFGISAISLVIALLYILREVKESLQVQEMPITSKIREFFRYELVVDLVRTCIAKRPHFDRTFIWLTMIALIITNFITQGESNIFYLFLRKKFNITLKQYSNYNAIANTIKIVGSILGIIVLRKIFEISIVMMAMLTLFSSILESTVRAAAQLFWEMYLGTVFGFLSSISPAMLLTILTFYTPSTEIGKVIALTTSLQTLTPLGAAPLYTSVYDATLNFYPGFFNIISVILYLLCFSFMALIFGIQKSKGTQPTTTTKTASTTEPIPET